MQQRLIFINNLSFDPLKQNHFNRNFRVKKTDRVSESISNLGTISLRVRAHYNGNENVALKVNLRPFSLHRNYSYPLTLSNVGEPSWSWIPRDHVQVQKEKLFTFTLFTFSVKREIRHFHVVVVQKREKKCTNKCDARAKLLFCL